MAGRPKRLTVETCLLAPVLLGLFLCGYSAVGSTNFGGYDEWLIRSLGDRLVLGFPYANRPLNLLWTLPGGLLDPHGFVGYYVVHGLYLWLAGVLLFVILRRLWPGLPPFAWLGAALVVTWAPSDRARLCTVQATFCSGTTMSLLLAVLLLLEARRRGSRLLLLAAGVVAWATVRGYEATLPLLLAAPLLVLVLPAAGRARHGAWWAAWAIPVGLATAQTLAPVLMGGEASAYQMENARLDPRPAAVLSRLAHQYERHLMPVVTSSARELRHGRVVLAATLFVGGLLLLRRLARADVTADLPARRGLLALAGGLTAAGLGYAPYVLSPIGAATDRTQYVSGPGIATALATAAVLVAHPLPPRWRWIACAVLGAWVVAVGTGRTLAMQSYWDRQSAHPRQAGTLQQLQALAPDLRPGTLVVLLDHCGDWPAVFTFRHAVEWTYGRRATGFLWRPGFRGQLFYPTAFTAAGVRTVPWETIQEGWDDRPTLHRYDEIVALTRRPEECRAALAPEWPDELPPLPPGARYVPTERILGNARP
jgi:hypothetical protein